MVTYKRGKNNAKPYNHRRAENEYKKWKENDERFMKKNGMAMHCFHCTLSQIISRIC